VQHTTKKQALKHFYQNNALNLGENNMSSADILFDEKPGINGNLGIITLNRPTVLNALNHQMFIDLHQQLIEWERNSAIKGVVIQAAAGRAFCAGGDIRYAYERGLAKDPTLPNFFRDEYLLDTYIYHYNKPYIALLDGITMGGGVGISLHGSHRIATQKLTFSMPETGIGFFPDVGATYFLPRLPGKIGMYLGLTGARINANDCLATGLVDHVIAENNLVPLVNSLAQYSFEKNSDAIIADCINHYSMTTEASTLMEHAQEINHCFAKNSIEEIVDALKNYPSEWCSTVSDELQKKSPTSLKITFKQLQLGKQMTFDECMDLEYRLAQHFLKSHDFYEGVRAAIIDKDQQPNWQPQHLNDVSTKEIEAYFLPLQVELSNKLVRE
jgi:enoyl-CoA hydratase